MPKRKGNDMVDSPSKKARMPATRSPASTSKATVNSSKAYTPQQKAAIQQFQNVTDADKVTAARYLKSTKWDAQGAVNMFFSSPGGGNNPSASASRAKVNLLNKMFDKYREDTVNDPDTIGAEGTMKYLGDIGVDLEGLDCLAVLETVKAPTMGEIGRTGFLEGWSELGCETLDQQKSYIKDLKRSLPVDKATFVKVYAYTFFLAKNSTQKSVPLDVASAYWELLFTSPLSALHWSTPSSPWVTWWLEFLNSEWKRSVNKDVWNQTLKFAQLTLGDERLGFWNEDASWPSVVDDFVEWVKRVKRGEGADVKGEPMEV